MMIYMKGCMSLSLNYNNTTLIQFLRVNGGFLI